MFGLLDKKGYSSAIIPIHFISETPYCTDNHVLYTCIVQLIIYCIPAYSCTVYLHCTDNHVLYTCIL